MKFESYELKILHIIFNKIHFLYLVISCDFLNIIFSSSYTFIFFKKYNIVHPGFILFRWATEVSPPGECFVTYLGCRWYRLSHILGHPRLKTATRKHVKAECSEILFVSLNTRWNPGCRLRRSGAQRGRTWGWSLSSTTLTTWQPCWIKYSELILKKVSSHQSLSFTALASQMFMDLHAHLTSPSACWLVLSVYVY